MRVPLPPSRKKKVPKIQVSSLYVPGVLSVALQNLDILLNFSGLGQADLRYITMLWERM